ncbi:MAG: M6 family metalloprotease domain-containing protein, partial [Prevotella sp.]|nr:M6 family metalloprotease domain-containing protein [Prevotella sp.]
MKKIVLLMAFCLMSVLTWAVKAESTPVVIIQSDGSQLTVIGHGDEDFHWYTTTDGVLLTRVGSDYYVASIGPKGELTASTQLAHESKFRSAAERKMAANQDKLAFQKTARSNWRKASTKQISIGTSEPPYFPHFGSPTALVILVEFQDTVFSVTDPAKTFNDYLNAEGKLEDYGFREDRNYGSVRQYFSDMSDGQFTPNFHLVGPVKLPETSAYYGAGNDNTTALIQDACNAVDDEVDFSQFDADGDGNVDLVYIIYAGYSASISGNSEDCIWPKSGSHNFGTWDGKKVRRYGVNNELNGSPTRYTSAPFKRVNGIGLFCHEFSHTLGLPDLYSQMPVDNQAMEYWDLMDGGEYTDNGYTPTPYTPWEKEVMEWTTLEMLTEPVQVELQPDEARKILVDDSEEYVIVHNVQGSTAFYGGSPGIGWASKMLGHGLLVYRIDYKGQTEVNVFDYPNMTEGKPGVTIVPADSLLITSYRMYS